MLAFIYMISKVRTEPVRLVKSSHGLGNAVKRRASARAGCAGASAPEARSLGHAAPAVGGRRRRPLDLMKKRITLTKVRNDGFYIL